MGEASRRGWALDWSVIIVKGPAWITYSEWRRDTQVARPTGCFIHNLALQLFLASAALFGLRHVWKSQTICSTWMLNCDQLMMHADDSRSAVELDAPLSDPGLQTIRKWKTNLFVICSLFSLPVCSSLLFHFLFVHLEAFHVSLLHIHRFFQSLYLRLQSVISPLKTSDSKQGNMHREGDRHLLSSRGSC